MPTPSKESRVTWPIFVVVVTLVGCMVAYKSIKEPKEQEPTAIVETSPESISASTPPTPPSLPAPIRIASWNVLNLGDNTPVDLRAEVISKFDIVALQEVESLVGLENLHYELEGQTQVPWDVVHSDLIGEGNAAEYYAFIYRDDIIDQVEGPEGVYPEPNLEYFSREPYFATFKAGNFDFTLITIHTDPSPQSLTTKEVQRLAEVWSYVQDLDDSEQDILLMGDFNKDKPTHKAFDMLEELGVTFLVTEEGTFTSYSTLETKIGANWYDNIWVDLSNTGHE